MGNHSCNPNLVDEKDGDHTFQGFEVFKTYAARDIKAGEELCYDYCLEYYDKGPFFSPCLCGAPNCRGSMNGFAGLTRAQQIELVPHADEYIKERYEAALQQRQTPPLLSRLYRICKFCQRRAGFPCFHIQLFSNLLAPCIAI